ncbi:hypothetical protein L873DRAFT_1671570 [Choiromyces venosus 120613-1]|uniref:Mannose-1-phosphate guanyltransferase n=1 Tax=Choiromyces venosus 120613-1 TaxID=1336337 RepID=A0A3N4IYL4_9PEZI|nr:hypothetical protein L873DRAFT_1831844 [Choiromyces venosus 120613-1]RPB03005.1 hypothetical protein L873DRAFT_1671570 [Choiromyces venosus 120613-1]
MLHYPIEWCDKAGFDTILILTLTEHQPAIQSYLRSHRAQKSSVEIRVESPSSLNDNLGTADIIRIAHKKGWIHGDFAVLPCDLITTMDSQEVMEMWMVEQAGFDSDMGRRPRLSKKAGDADGGRRGGLGIWYETRGEGATKGMETEFIAVVPHPTENQSTSKYRSKGTVSSLLFNMPTHILKGDDVSSEFPIRRSLLDKHPKLQLYTTRRDSGIYFFPYWVLKFIEENPKMASLREDVVPWLAKCCWQNRRLADKLGLLDILVGSEEEDDLEEIDVGERYDVGSMSTNRARKLEKPRNEPTVELGSETTRAIKARMLAKAEVPIPEITAYLPNQSKSFIRRVDTTHLYLFTCLHLAKSDPQAASTQVKIDPSASIDPKAIVSSFDCLIADKVSIGEKANIKRSVLGSGVSIGRGVRLIGCVLMDGASVAEGAKLEGCTVGRKAIVGVKASLKDCEIAENYVVDEGTEAKNERFVLFTGLDADASDASDASGQDSDGNYDDNDHSDSESAENDNEEESESENLTPKPATKSVVDLAVRSAPAKDLPPPYSLETPTVPPSEPKATNAPEGAPAKDITASSS